MDPLLIFIENIEPWQFMISAILLLVISAISGEFDLLPWVSLSTFVVALTDYIGFSPTFQLAIFSVSLVFFVIVGRRFLNKSNDPRLIAEDINQMVHKSVRITKINSNDGSKGEAISENGKTWNVNHLDNKKIKLNVSYKCKSIEGINLIVE
ncbi:hypothetical protein OAI34_08565 [Emcibacteraceae bacterium]|nr:hypothetical protein [Emcibacteraceae bacterium]